MDGGWQRMASDESEPTLIDSVKRNPILCAHKSLMYEHVSNCSQTQLKRKKDIRFRFIIIRNDTIKIF